jgi:hypothetical protein
MQATVQNPIVATGLNIVGDVYNDLEKLTIDELVFGMVGDLAMEATVQDQTIATKRLKVFRDIFNGDESISYDATVLREALNDQELILVQQLLEYW